MKMLKKEITKYYKWGSPNVTLNNMATKVNGVASGMTNNNYLALSKIFDISKAGSWEMQAKIKTTSDITTQQVIINSWRFASAGGSCGSALRVYNGNIEFLVPFTANISSYVTLSYKATANTEYLVKGEFTGSAYNLYINNKLVATKATTSKGIYNATYNNIIGLGFVPIDVSQSYIKIDGEFLWSGETDGYDRYGAWVDEGVMSGFTTSSYGTACTIPPADSIEFGGKFSYSSSITGTACIFELFKSGWYGFNIAVANNQIRLWTNSGWSGKAITIGTTYWFRCECNSAGSTIYLSTDGKTYTKFASTTANEYSSWGGSVLALGIRNYNKTEPFTGGSIYLQDCYVKVNDKEHWTGLKTVESTKSDYKFTEQKPVYYACKTGNKYYALGE